MWLAWWWPSGTKPCLTIHHFRVFKKRYAWPCSNWWTIVNDSRSSLWSSKTDAETLDFVYSYGIVFNSQFINCALMQFTYVLMQISPKHEWTLTISRCKQGVKTLHWSCRWAPSRPWDFHIYIIDLRHNYHKKVNCCWGCNVIWYQYMVRLSFLSYATFVGHSIYMLL